MKSLLISNIFFFTLFLVTCNTSKAQSPPFSVSTGLFDQSNTINLGLSKVVGAETYSVFNPTSATDHFSNGVAMVAFKNKLYCMWQSSATDEDAADTWVAYSISEDGKTWTTPKVIATTISNGYSSSGGWWATNDTLIGYINTWPANLALRGGYTRYVASTDGLNWSEPRAVKMANGDTLKGIFEQDPHVIPGGRIINAAHLQPGLIVSPIYTDDLSGIRGWKKANFTPLSTSNPSREMEPSNFVQSDGKLVMIFRDQNSTFFKLASVSTDRGENWSQAVLTNMPDSRSKQCAGNLPNGTAYFASNPVTSKTRFPLAVTLSKDGNIFNTAYVLREGGADLQALRYTGKSKSLGYSYPKSLVWRDSLYVAYSTNKEDVQYTRIPLTGINLNTTGLNSISSLDNNEKLHFNVDNFNQINILVKVGGYNVDVLIYSITGKLLLKSKMLDNHSSINMSKYAPGIYIITVKTQFWKESKLFNLK